MIRSIAILLVLACSFPVVAELVCDVNISLSPEISRVTSIAKAQFLTGGVQNDSVKVRHTHTLSPGNLQKGCGAFGRCSTSNIVESWTASTTYTALVDCEASQLESEVGRGSDGDTATTPDAERPRTDPYIPPQHPTDPNAGCPSEQCTPLILDLNGDGIQTTSLESGAVEFDISGDGVRDRTAWTNAATEEGILYFDLNRNRSIDGGAELFGDSTILPDGRRAKNGFEALSMYDTSARGGNGDGIIGPGDAVWGILRLWVDRNHDGLASSDENYPLPARGVVDISLVAASLPLEQSRDASGNAHRLQGTFRQRDGVSVVTRAIHDVYFRALLR